MQLHHRVRERGLSAAPEEGALAGHERRDQEAVPGLRGRVWGQVCLFMLVYFYVYVFVACGLGGTAHARVIV